MIFQRKKYLIALILFSGIIAIWGQIEQAHAQTKGGKDKAKSKSFAIVNGKELDEARYNELLNDKLNFLQQGGFKVAITPEIADACYIQAIEEEILMQEAKKKNVDVTREAALKSLLESPPQFVQDMFRAPDGSFRADVFRVVIQTPEQVIRFVSKPGKSEKQIIQEWKADVEQLIQFVQREQLKVKLSDALYKAKPLTVKMVKDHYFAEKTLITGSVVRAHHLSIPDSLVPVTDAEAKAWYKANKSDYDFTETRYINSMIFQMSPTKNDSVKLKREMDSVVKRVNELPLEKRGAYVTSVMRNLPESKLPNGSYYGPSKVPRTLIDQVQKAKEGTIIGPIVQGFNASLIYVDKTMPARDTMIRVRHIFFKSLNDYYADSSYVALLSKVKDTIKTEDDFMKFARDLGQDATRAKGGDLGYLARGNSVRQFDSAIFANPVVGRVVGPIKTEFGIHLIYISDLWTTGYQIRELSFPYQYSDRAKEEIRSDAQKYYQLLKDGAVTDSLVNAMKAKYPGSLYDTSQIERMENYGNTNILNEFAFNANVGDIGMFETPGNRITITKLLYKRPGGIPPYEAFPNYVAAQARRAKQLSMLKPKMDSLAKIITVDMLVGPMEEFAKIVNVFLFNGQAINAMPDEDPALLDSLVTITKSNQFSGPVKGKNGYYFLRVRERTGPSMQDWELYKDSYTPRYAERYKTTLLNELLAKAKTKANVKDLRPSTIKILKEYIKIDTKQQEALMHPDAPSNEEGK